MYYGNNDSIEQSLGLIAAIISFLDVVNEVQEGEVICLTCHKEDK